MAEVKWIKIVTDIFDDEKLLLIESLPDHDAIIVTWFKLLCLAGKMNNSGVFVMNGRIAYTDEMLATIFRRSLNTVRLALETFERFGMIEKIEGVITIPNWSKHQSLDQLESKKEYMKQYMVGYREKQKLLAECKTNGKANCKTNSKANVSSLDKIREEEIREEYISVDKPLKPQKVIPPILADVKAYCKERNNNIDPNKWYDHYTANGWMVGKNKMKDWKAAVRTWEQMSKQNERVGVPINNTKVTRRDDW